MTKRWLLLLPMLLLLTGCIIRSPEELYSLPEQSDEYDNLQTAISAIMTEDMQYSSPVSGTNRQPVQMADLDGDGQNEAVVFLKTGGEMPLKAYVFDRVGRDYQNVFVIEGDGSAFAQVEYAQIDGADGVEIIIGRQLNGQVLQSIGAYSIQNGQLVELMSSSYSELALADIDGNGNRDLFLMRFVSEGHAGVAELYRWIDGDMVREPEQSLSVGVSAVRNIQVGNLTADLPAIFIGGVLADSSIITDVFCFQNGEFTCISSANDLGLHSHTVRGYNVYCSDIDGDGIVELPDVVQLPTVLPEEDAYYAIRWMEYAPKLESKTVKMTTYHHYSGGWYLRIPERLGLDFTISRDNTIAGVSGLVFRLAQEDGPGEELFTIYAFTGSDRNAAAAADGRFQLGAKSDTTYAAMLGDGAERLELTQAELVSMFRFIRVDWNSGET